MKLVRSTTATALACIAALGAGVAPAVAGSKYSQKKCNSTYNKAVKKYPVNPKLSPKKQKSNSKKLNSVLVNLTTKHGCHIGG